MNENIIRSLTTLTETQIQSLEALVASKYPKQNSLILHTLDQELFAYEAKTNTLSSPQHLASVTKSIMSLLVGIAIDQKLITSVDDKVLNYLPDYSAGKNMIQRSVTIKHLLTMTAPFAFSLKSINARPFEPLDRLRRQKDWVKFILSIMGKGQTLGRFQYSTPSTHLLSAIITKTSGMTTCAFANKYLFEPLGLPELKPIEMTSFRLEDLFGAELGGWVSDPQGINTGGWGISLSPYDMVEIGRLYLNGGLHEGATIVSQDWIQATRSEQVQGYGYLWWLKTIGQQEAYAALGYGGNIICCLPEMNLLIVSTGQMVGNNLDPWVFIEDVVTAIL